MCLVDQVGGSFTIVSVSDERARRPVGGKGGGRGVGNMNPEKKKKTGKKGYQKASSSFSFYFIIPHSIPFHSIFPL